MKRLIITISFVLLNSIIAQELSIDTAWTKTFGGTNNDYCSNMDQTTDGGYIMTGWTSSFGNSSDVWLVKTDSEGNEEWNQTFGDGLNDRGNDVQQTTDGGYIITGYKGTVSNDHDIYLIKTDSNGNEEWQYTYHIDGYGRGHSVQQTTDGGYIITGKTGYELLTPWHIVLLKTDSLGQEEWYSLVGNESGFSLQQESGGGYVITGADCCENSFDLKLIKANALGDTLWSKAFDFGGDEFGRALQLTDDGYIITGESTDSLDAPTDVLLVRTDIEGDTLWVKTFGGDYRDMGKDVHVLDDGYIIAGTTRLNGNGYHDSDFWLIKTDSNGNEQWSFTLGGVMNDQGRAVIPIDDDSYIIAGTMNWQPKEPNFRFCTLFVFLDL